MKKLLFVGAVSGLLFCASAQGQGAPVSENAAAVTTGLNEANTQNVRARAFLNAEQGKRFDELILSKTPLTATGADELNQLLLKGLTEVGNYTFYTNHRRDSKENAQKYDAIERLRLSNLAEVAALREALLAQQPAAAVSAPLQISTTKISTPVPLLPNIQANSVVIGVFDSSLVGSDKNAKLEALLLLLGEAKRQGITIISPKDAIWWNSPDYRTVDLTPVLGKGTATEISGAPEALAVAPISTSGLSTAQVVAVKAALKSLRKLQAATSVGVTRAIYGEKLIDVKAEVEEALAEVPDGEIKININAAMSAYADASTVWDASFQLDYVSVYLIKVQPIFNRYGIAVKKPKGLARFTDRYSDLLRFDYISAPLSTIWSAARTDIEKAQSLISPTP